MNGPWRCLLGYDEVFYQSAVPNPFCAFPALKRTDGPSVPDGNCQVTSASPLLSVVVLLVPLAESVILGGKPPNAVAALPVQKAAEPDHHSSPRAHLFMVLAVGISSMIGDDQYVTVTTMVSL